MAEFFITLPSNVPDHPENSSSSFLVRLPEPIMLKTEKWKCGLSEIIYTNSFENIPDPLKFTAIDKNGKRVDYYLPPGNYRDALALVDSLSGTTNANRRKRSTPTEIEKKPLTEAEQKVELERMIAAGQTRPATAEEIEAKREQIKRRKAAATALVVASALASDAASYVPPPPPPPPKSEQPGNTASQQPSSTVQPSTVVQQSTPTVQPSSSSKPDDESTSAKLDSRESKYDEMFENLLNKFIKQLDSASGKAIKSAKQNTDSLIEESRKLQALLQDSIKENRNECVNIVKGSKKHADMFVEESQKLQELIKETITIQKANAADSKRIANQANLRSYSLGQANEQYSKYGFSFDFDPLLHRIIIYMNKNVLKGLELSHELAYLCGFSLQSDKDPYLLDEYKNIASYSIDFNNNLSAIFVYADCVQPSIVGNSKSQLLRIIPTSDKSSTVSTVFNPIQHLSINKEFIDTIRIKICDAYGKPIKFHFGTTICTLHFVKIKP